MDHKLDYMKDRRGEDSIYRKYYLKNTKKQHWKGDKKSSPLGGSSKFSSIVSRNIGAKIRLPNLSNSGRCLF